MATMRTVADGMSFIESTAVPPGTLAYEDGCSFCTHEQTEGLRQVRFSKYPQVENTLRICSLCRLDLIHHLSARM